MFSRNSFGKTLDIIHRELDVSQMRRSVIANNIANADTPGFKRSTLNFESMLSYALSTEKRPRFQTAITNVRHIPFYRPMDYREVLPRRVLDFTTTAKNNGNNVDIEQESIDAMNNQLLYQLLVQSVSEQFARVQSVLRR